MENFDIIKALSFRQYTLYIDTNFIDLMPMKNTGC